MIKVKNHHHRQQHPMEIEKHPKLCVVIVVCWKNVTDSINQSEKKQKQKTVPLRENLMYPVTPIGLHLSLFFFFLFDQSDILGE